MKDREILAGASQITDPDARTAFLDKACAGDVALRARVDRLLQSCITEVSSLDVSTPNDVGGATRTIVPSTGPELAETRAPEEGESDIDLRTMLLPSKEVGSIGRLDHYEVLGVLGRGGMGVVLKAHDTKLRRIVAVKLLSPTLAAVSTARRRFAREAQSAAAVREQHVVKIHTVCEDAKVPYLVMEFVDGITLEDRIRQKGRIDTKEILRIGMQAARGLSAAHAQGLVHRDVKPGNILLEDSVQRVKLTDFGLARAADDATISRSGVIAGTPMYMSPEQARGDHVDTRSDLFSLGSVLYTLCTGTPAFKADNSVAVLTRVCDDHPKPIREVNPAVPKWVCAVIEKLMAKNADDRLESAEVVADLFTRYLAHLEDPARVPPPPPIKGIRAEGRRRLRRFAVAALAACALVAVVMIAYRAFRPVQENPPAKSRPETTPLANWKAPTPEELTARPSPLDSRKRSQIPAELLALAGNGNSNSAPSELVAILGDTHFQLDGLGKNLECSPDGRLLAVMTMGKVCIFDIKTGRLKRTIEGAGRGSGAHLTFNSDGSLLLAPDEKETVRMWEVESGKLVQTFRGHSPYTLNVLFGPAGTVITSGADGTARIFVAATGEEKHVLPHGTHVNGLALNSDRTLLATGCNDRGVRIWDVATGDLKKTLPGHTAEVLTVHFSPDGKWLASGSGNELKLWNASAFDEARTLGTSAGWFQFSSDSSTVLCSPNFVGDSGRATATRWKVENGTKQADLPLLIEGMWHKFALTPDDRTLFHIVDGKSRFVRTYDGNTGKPRDGNVDETWAVAVSPDGRTIASGAKDGTLHLWDVAGWKVDDRQPTVLKWTGHTAAVYSIAFSPDNKLIVSASQDGTIRLWDVVTGEMARILQGETSKIATDVVFSADGKLVAAGDEDGSVRLWDVSSGEERTPLRWHTQHTNSVAVSPDNRFVVSAGLHDRKVYITDLRTLQRVSTLGPATEGKSEMKVAIGADGRTLAYGGWDDTIRLWDLVDNKETTLSGNVPDLDGLAVDPAGRFVAASRAGLVRIWDRTAPDRPLVIGPGPFGSAARQITFTPEGRYIVVAGSNGTVSILRTPAPPPTYKPGPPPSLPNIAELAKLPVPADGLDQENLPPGMAASLVDPRFRLPKRGLNGRMVQDREGKWLAVPNADMVAIFDAQSGELLRTLIGVGRMYVTAISPDGNYFASASSDKDYSIIIWDVRTWEKTSTLKGHTAAIKSIAFSPDSKRLISSADDANNVWDLQTKNVIHTLAAKSDFLYHIGISPDGKKIVCSDKASKTAKVFDDSGKLLTTLTGHASDVKYAAYSVDGKLLATGSNSDLQLWDADNLKLVKKIDTPAAWIAFEPDGKTFLTAAHEFTASDPNHVVTRWDLKTFEKQPLPSLGNRTARVLFHLSPNGKVLYSIVAHGVDNAGERSVRAYDAITGKELFTRQGHSGQVWSVAASADGKYLASAGEDGEVRIWDLANGKQLHVLARPTRPYSVAFSPDGKTLVIGCDNGPLTLFDPASGIELRTLDGGDLSVPWFAKMSFSHDGTLFALGGMDGLVRVWDFSSGALRRTIWAGPGQVFATSFSPDGKVLAAGNERGGVGIWDLATGWQVESFPKQRGAVKWVGFRPDGRSLAVAGLWRGDTIELDSPKYNFTPSAEQKNAEAGEFISKTFTKRLDAGQSYKFVMTSLDDQVAPLLIVDEAGDGKQIHSSVAQSGKTIVKPSPASETPVLKFDGNGLVVIPSLKITEDHAFTVETWAVLEDPVGRPRNFDLIANARISGFALCAPPGKYGGDGNKLGFMIRTTTPDDYVTAWEKKPVPRNQLVHLAGVYDGKAEIWFYVDGQLQSRVSARNVKPSILPLSLGGNSHGSDKGSRFSGWMNEVHISKVARYDADFTPDKRFKPDSDTIALYHFDEGNGPVLRDSSGNGHHGQIDGAQWVKLNDAKSGPRAVGGNLVRTELTVTPTKTGNCKIIACSQAGPGWFELTVQRGTASAEWLGFGYVPVFDLLNDKETRLVGHSSGISAGTWRADGRVLFTVGEDATLRTWDMSASPPFGRLLRGLPTGRLNGIALTSEARYAAIASSDGTIPVMRLPELPPPYAPGPPRSAPDPQVVAAQPAAADALKRESIPAELRKVAVGGDAAKAPPPEVVAIFGDARFTLPKSGKNASMAQDKEGKFLAVANGSSVAVFNASTGELLRTVTSTSGRSYALAISPDGHYLAVGNHDGDNAIRIWNLNSGNVTKTLKAHTSRIWSVIFSPDGTRLISASNDGTKVWDLKTDKVIRSLEVDSDGLLQIGLSPDGKKIACGDKSSTTVKVFDADSGKLLGTLKGHSNYVRRAAFSPDGSLLATGSDFDLCLWDAEKLELVKTVETVAGWLAFDPHGKTLLTARHDSGAMPTQLGQVVTRWDIKTFEGTPLATLSNRTGYVFFQLSPDGKTIYSVVVDGRDQDRSVRVYDAVTGKEQPRQGHNGQVFGVGFSPDGKRLASVGIDPGIWIWDPATGKLVSVLPNDQGFYRFAYSADGKLIAGGEIDGTVVLYDANTSEKIRVFPAPKSPVRMVAFSPDGQYIAAACHAGVVNVWEVSSGRLRYTLSGRVWEAWSVAFSPDGKTLATGWENNEVILFDVATGWETASIRVGVKSIRWLGFHPDGRSLGVVGVGTGTQQAMGIWDLATRKEVRRLTVPGSGHLSGAWRADGLLLASSGDRDGTIRLWNFDDKPEQQQVIQLYPPNTSWLHGLAFSPDGRHLATGNPDGTISILRLAKPGELFEPNPPALVSRDVLAKHANPIKLLEDALLSAPDAAAKTKIIAEAATIDGLLEKLADRGVSDGQVQAELARRFAAKGNATLASAARSKARTSLEESLVKEPENTAFATELTQVLLDDRLSRNPIRWMVLKPVEAKSTLGATLTLLPDDSILVGGANPSRDMYRVVLQVPKDIDSLAFRLEALTHPSLPKNGPGRSASGSGAMASWKVTALLPTAKDPIKLSFVDAWADAGSPNYPVSTNGHWNLYGDAGHDGTAVWSMAKPVTLSAGTTLTFEIQCHTTDNGENLGHFRLSAASSGDSASLGEQQKCFSTSRLADPWAKLGNAYTVNERLKDAMPYWVRSIQRADGYEARKPILEFATRFGLIPAIANQLLDDSQVQLALARYLAELGKRRLADKQSEDAWTELKRARDAFRRLPTSDNPWAALKPIEMQSNNGIKMDLEKDGSIFVHQDQQQPPKNDVYTVVFSSDMKGITGLRLEVFADSRMPNGGPGWGPTGNFQLNSLTLQAAPAAAADKARTIALRNPSADHSQDRGNFDVRKTISKHNDHGWGISGAVNKDHTAVFELSEEVGDGQPTRLMISFNHPYKTPGYNVGRFRLSFTNDAKTLEATRIGLDLKDSERFGFYLDLGIASAQQGQANEAAASFVEALSFAPDLAGKSKIIAAAAPFKGVLEEVAKQTENDGLFQAELVRHLATKDPAMANAARTKARAALQERLSKDPDNAKVAGDLAQLLLDQYSYQNAARWSVLEPSTLKSTGGATLTKLADQSILAGGENPPGDQYSVEFIISQKTEIRALRLEALAHDSLPKHGPGRASNGAGAIIRWDLTAKGPENMAKPRTLPFRAVCADYQYKDMGLSGHWNLTFGEGADHASIWIVDPATLNAGDELRSLMHFNKDPRWADQSLGRFRLSVSSDPNAFIREQRLFEAKKVNDPWAKLAAAYYLFGEYQKLGNLLEAHPAAAVGSGDLWMVDKQWESAIVAYSRAVAAQPDNADFLLKLVGAYQAGNRTIESIPHLVKASTANPKDSFLWLKIAALQGWFGHEKDLAATRQRVLAFAKGTNDWNTANRAAKICCIVPLTDQTELEEALALARIADGLQKSEWNLLSLGMAEYRKDNYAAADEALQAVPTVGNKNGVAVGTAAFFRAMILSRQGKNDEARKLAISTAVKVRLLPSDEKNPFANASHDDVIYWLAFKEAMTLLKIDQSPVNLLEQARNDEEKALGPNDPSILALTQRLADAYVAAGRTREAVPHLAKLSATKLTDHLLMMKVAALQGWFGQDKELAATRKWLIGLSTDTNDPNTGVARACCIAPLTDKTELESLLAIGRTFTNNSSKHGRFGWLAAGMAEYRNGNDAAAITALLRVGPDSEPAWLYGTTKFYRAMALFRQGKTEEARKLASETAAKMKPLPSDEKNPISWVETSNDRHVDNLILWLAYKEAKAMIKFDARPPEPEK